MAAYSLFTLFDCSRSIGLRPTHTAVMVVLLHKHAPVVTPVARSMRVCALNLISTVHHGFTSLLAMFDFSSKSISLSMPLARRLTSLAKACSSLVNGEFILFAFLS